MEQIVDKPLFIENQELIAELVIDMIKKNESVFVCLLGISTFEYSDFAQKKFDGSIFKPFYEKLFSYNEVENKIGLYYHPSRRYLITLKQQERIKGAEFSNDEIQNFFKELGKEELNIRSGTIKNAFDIVLQKHIKQT